MTDKPQPVEEKSMENLREMNLETALSRLLRDLDRFRGVMVAAKAWEEWKASTDDRPRDEIERALFDAISALT